MLLVAKASVLSYDWLIELYACAMIDQSSDLQEFFVIQEDEISLVELRSKTTYRFPLVHFFARFLLHI